VWGGVETLLCCGPMKDEKLVLLMPKLYPPCGYKPCAGRLGPGSSPRVKLTESAMYFSFSYFLENKA